MSLKVLTILIILLSFSPAAADEIFSILRGDGIWKPFEWLEEGGLRGFHVELIREACRRGEISYTIDSYPWVRAVAYATDGRADAIMFIVYTNERNEYLRYDDRNILYYSLPVVVVKKGKGFSYSGNIEELLGKQIGIVRGYNYGPLYEDSKSFLNLEETSSEEALLHMLETDRVEAIIINYVDFVMNHGDSPVFKTLEILLPPFDRIPHYIAFSRSVLKEELFERFSRAMAELKTTPFYEELLRKYQLLPPP